MGFEFGDNAVRQFTSQARDTSTNGLQAAKVWGDTSRMMTMPPQLRTGSHRLRLGRTSESGRFYLLTTVTRHRLPVFTDVNAARTLVRILAHQHATGRVDSYAFVVMPDHMHWLVQLKEDRLDSLMGRVKSISSRQIPKLSWQPGYHDHALRQEDDLRRMARYIIRNPLRAGLAESVGDYPHWDAIWL